MGPCSSTSKSKQFQFSLFKSDPLENQPKIKLEGNDNRPPNHKENLPDEEGQKSHQNSQKIERMKISKRGRKKIIQKT